MMIVVFCVPLVKDFLPFHFRADVSLRISSQGFGLNSASEFPFQDGRPHVWSSLHFTRRMMIFSSEMLTYFLVIFFCRLFLLWRWSASKSWWRIGLSLYKDTVGSLENWGWSNQTQYINNCNEITTRQLY